MGPSGARYRELPSTASRAVELKALVSPVDGREARQQNAVPLCSVRTIGIWSARLRLYQLIAIPDSVGFAGWASFPIEEGGY